LIDGSVHPTKNQRLAHVLCQGDFDDASRRSRSVRIRTLNWAFVVVAAVGLLATRASAQNGSTAEFARSPVESLHAENVDVRRAAANKIRMSSRRVQRDALPAMIEVLMKEKDGQVRLAVLDTITAMGPDAAPAVDALVHTLRTNYGGQGKEELHQDYRSALALAAIGKPAVEGLRGLLGERKENVRAEVVMALGRIGPNAGAAVADLVPLLGDKSERIRQEATRALGRIGEAAVEPLIAASAHQDAGVRARAVESLGMSSTLSDGVRRAVLERSHDASPEVRAAATRSLARLALPDDVLLPVLKEDLKDEDEQVRLAAVNLLIARRALLLPLVPQLASLLTGKHDGVAHHAAFLLGKVGPDAAPKLLEALRDENSRIDPIAEALAQIGRSIVPTLIRAVEASEPRVRRGAALALGQIRPLAPEVVPKLTAGLNDPDTEVKGAFLTAIRNLGPRARESVSAVRAMLHDQSAENRIHAVEILAQSAPRDARLVGDLSGLLNDADARVQRQAMDTLRSLGPLGRDALPLVIKKLDSPHAEVRLAAAEMIGSHGQASAEAVPALSSLLTDPAPELRTTAAQTLGKLGRVAQPAFPKLTPLLEAQQVEVREAAASALGSLDLEVDIIRPHLAKAMQDRESKVRRAAMRAVQRLGPQGAVFVPDLIVLARNKETAMGAERLLRRFERRGPDLRSLPELVKLLEHDQETVRLLASKFLGLAGRNAHGAIPALERLREDPSMQVRKQAEAACELIKNDSGPSSQRKPRS
jgi:HEAT repeat protein